MPWRETTKMSQKLEFITRLQHYDGNFSRLCEAFGISRTTGYKWCKRHADKGEPGLHELSRRPQCSPTITPAPIQQQVLAVRDLHPTWGGRKIHWSLKHQDCQQVPAASTITAILRRTGRLSPDTPSPAVRRFEKAFPNESWQVDFKGHHATALAGRCHPLTITDDHSRFNILLNAYPGEQYKYVRAGLIYAFRTYGMPVALQFDNGPPWGSIQQSGRVLTVMDIWLMRLGIEVRHIPPHHPQSNGKAERFHRTLKQEVIRGRTFSDLDHCQRVFDQWRCDYNLRRPHEALGHAVPATRYQPSPRCYHTQLPAVQYESGVAVRKVSQAGRLQFKGRQYKIGKALKGEIVALRETTVDGEYEVYYCQQKIVNLSVRCKNNV